MRSLRGLSPAKKAFVSHVLAHCKEHGVHVRFEDKTNVGGMKQSCVGYFNHVDKKLIVAKRDSKWVQTLAHEYGHFLQWVDDEIWYEPAIDAGWIVFDDWITHKREAKPARIEAITRHIQECELDAERRAVKLFDEWDLQISDYIVKSNVYVMAYEAARRLRKWHNKEHPTLIEDLVDLMPRNRFVRRDRLHCLPKGFVEIYEHRCCF